jgi:hypothetical protein
MKTILLTIAVFLAVLAFVHTAKAWPSEKQTDTKAYSLNANGSIAVENSSGDVEVVGWDESQVEVTETKTAWSSGDLARLSTQVDGNAGDLGIRADYPNDCFNCDISYVVRAPRGAHVTVQTSSGDVTVRSVAGPVRVDSSSGDVKAEQLSGEAHIHSSSGSLTLDGDTSSVQAVTSSGDIDAKGLEANADLVATSGDVKLEYSSFGSVKSIRAESSSGDITLIVPRGAGFRIQATTTSGSIDSNLRLPIRDRDSGADVSAQVGDGTAAVQLLATSGDINVTMR